MGIVDAEAISMTEASERGISKLAAEAAAGHTTVLRRRADRVAGIVGYDELVRLGRLERDLTDLALVLARTATDTGARTSLDAVIGELGFTREQLEEMPDPA
jgi:hypothetical protein